MDIQWVALVVITLELLLPHSVAEFVKFIAIFMCVFRHPFSVGVCPNSQTVQKFATSLGVAANRTIIPIMRAAEWVPVRVRVQKGVFFVELDRTVVRSLSHLKRTVPGLVWKRTETSCSGRSRSSDPK